MSTLHNLLSTSQFLSLRSLQFHFFVWRLVNNFFIPYVFLTILQKQNVIFLFALSFSFFFALVHTSVITFFNRFLLVFSYFFRWRHNCFRDFVIKIFNVYFYPLNTLLFCFSVAIHNSLSLSLSVLISINMLTVNVDISFR